MIEAFLTPDAYPFSIALCVVLGLFILELISLILGGSIMAIGSDAPDVDLDIEPDLDTDVSGSPAGVLGWLGIGEVPFLIWLVSFLTVFGLSGLFLLTVAGTVTDLTPPLAVTVPIAIGAATYCARFIARIVATIMPKTESSAMRTRFLGGHHGTITQGTARRGSPAEAKIKDRHGNTHYLRVEPLEDDVEIPQGADVHVIRKRDGMFFVVDITT